MRRQRRRAPALVGAVLFITACHGPARTRAESDPPGLAPRSACAGELARAERTAALLERSWPVRGSSPLLDLARTVGGDIAAHAPPPTAAWRFLLLDDGGANAFSIGGGRIYVSRGMIAACRSEAELAAILAHEMAHELLGHFCEARPPGERRELGLVRQRLDPAEERAADAASVPLLVAAGYNAHAALDIVRRLDDDATWTSDPTRASALAATLEGIPAGGRADSAAFRALNEVARDQPRRAGGRGSRGRR
jgi:beta-barrel assembly-enhancing protease